MRESLILTTEGDGIKAFLKQYDLTEDKLYIGVLGLQLCLTSGISQSFIGYQSDVDLLAFTLRTDASLSACQAISNAIRQDSPSPPGILDNVILRSAYLSVSRNAESFQESNVSNGIALSILNKNDILHIYYTYSTEALNEEAIIVFHMHFETLLRDILTNPQKLFYDLNIVSPFERDFLEKKNPNAAIIRNGVVCGLYMPGEYYLGKPTRADEIVQWNAKGEVEKVCDVNAFRKEQTRAFEPTVIDIKPKQPFAEVPIIDIKPIKPKQPQPAPSVVDIKQKTLASTPLVKHKPIAPALPVKTEKPKPPAAPNIIDIKQKQIISEISSPDKEFWRTVFTGMDDAAEFIPDYPRGWRTAPETAELQHDWSEWLPRLQEKSSETRSTEEMLLLCGLMIMMYRYGRRSDVVVGVSRSKRLLPLRGYPSEEKTFAQFLEDIKKTVSRAEEYAAYPYDEFAAACGRKRDKPGHPYIDVAFVCENDDPKTSKFKPNAAFDLSIRVNISDDTCIVDAVYRADLYRKSTIEGFMHHLENLMMDALEFSKKTISELNCMSHSERNLILGKFNKTDAPFPSENIVSLFEEQVLLHPNKSALEYWGSKLTYEQLNDMANETAQRLKAVGVGSNDMVVLAADRCFEMFAGMLAILKIGAAYIPFAFSSTAEHAQSVFWDGRPKAVVWASVFAVSPLLQNLSLPIIRMDVDMASASSRNDHAAVNVRSLAFCVYTASGLMKGVLTEHRGVVNLSHTVRTNFGVNETDCILQYADFTSELFVWEWTMALLCGGTLRLIPSSIKSDMDALSGEIQDGVTVAILPASIAAELKIDKLRLLITPGHAAQRQTPFTSKRCVNVYGSAEMTSAVTVYEKSADAPLFDGPLPIGRPICNTRVYILNGQQLCGIGIPGELCATGAGIARGYLGQPAFSVDKFTQNPYSKEMLYRTGDLARWLPDGNIELLGRLDTPMNIAGHWVEMGEIERVLKRQYFIKDAAVTVRHGKDKEPAICAYIVTSKTMSLPRTRLLLRQTLPGHMVPKYMAIVSSLPKTPGGRLLVESLPGCAEMQTDD